MAMIRGTNTLMVISPSVLPEVVGTSTPRFHFQRSASRTFPPRFRDFSNLRVVKSRYKRLTFWATNVAVSRILSDPDRALHPLGRLFPVGCACQASPGGWGVFAPC